MAKDHKDRQREYRERQARRLARAERIETALREIGELVKGSDKPTGMKIREIVEEALNG